MHTHIRRHITRAIDDFIQKSRPKLPEEVPLSKIELETDEKKPEVLGDDGPLGESKVEPDDAAAAMDAATEMDAKGKIEAQRENDAMVMNIDMFCVSTHVASFVSGKHYILQPIHACA